MHRSISQDYELVLTRPSPVLARAGQAHPHVSPAIDEILRPLTFFPPTQKHFLFCPPHQNASAAQCYDSGLCLPPNPCSYAPVDGFQLKPLPYGSCARLAVTCRNTATSEIGRASCRGRAESRVVA